jgi:hypothetical protein
MIQVHDLRHVDTDVVEAWADHVAAHLRQCDLDEVAAMTGLEPEDAMRSSLALSTHAFAVVSHQGGAPIAIFGAAPHPLPGVGIVWMLGTDDIRKEAYSIAKATRRYFDELNAAYWMLWNFIDARNTVSLRWLRWGGFKLLGDHDFNGHRFHTFARTNINV